MLPLFRSFPSPFLRTFLASSCPFLASAPSFTHKVLSAPQPPLDIAASPPNVPLLAFLSSSALFSPASMHRAATARVECFQSSYTAASPRRRQVLTKGHPVFTKAGSIGNARELTSSVYYGSVEILPMRKWSRGFDNIRTSVVRQASSYRNEPRSHLRESEESFSAADYSRCWRQGDVAQEPNRNGADSCRVHEATICTKQDHGGAKTRSVELDSSVGTAVVCESGIETSNATSRVSAPSNVESDESSVGDPSVRKSSSDDAVRTSRNQSERRRRTSLLARHLNVDVPDLLAVPGIGPRNMEKLVAKGIGRVAELKQLYRDKFLNHESSKMVEYLQSAFGIVHKNHAERITTFVKRSVDEELKEQQNLEDGNAARKKVTICVEGNISVGKTTFLQKIASERIELRDLVEIVPEPVGKWKDVGPDHFNLLDAFYNEPERYAYTFQNYVFATRLVQEQQTANGLKPLRLMERSIFTDRLVFVRAIHEAKWMSELELRIYESWFDPFISALPGLVPDGFIYLRASPDTCLRRLHMRNRPEERTVTLDYLKELHEKHEQCFFPAESKGGILSVSQWPDGPHIVPPPPQIKDHLFYLQGDHLHSSIQKVPALVLDCETTIDFNGDFEARATYAQQVAEFYKYIQSTKNFEMEKKAQNETVSPLLPHASLLKPNGSSIFQGRVLNSFDLTRHASAFL